MNKPDTKQLLAGLRTYYSLVIPLVIALVAVAIIVLTPVLFGGKLRKKIDQQSLAKARSAESLARNIVPKDQWKEAAEYQQAHAEDVNQINIVALQTTKRNLLSYKVFPEPAESSVLLFEDFGRAFRTGIESKLSAIGAKDRPSQAEIDRVLNQAGVQSTKIDVGPFGPMSTTGSKSEIENTVRDALAKSRANSTSVYVNPSDIAGYDYWQAGTTGTRSGVPRFQYTGQKEATEECWNWQLGYWIIEDILDTIESLNQNGANVLDVPVKRLAKISFQAGTGRSASLAPSYVTAQNPGLVESFTTRVSDEDIDVVHFTVQVLVSSDAVLKFMDELCSGKTHEFTGFDGKEQPQQLKHNQITILESTFVANESEEESDQMYYYGDDAIMLLNLTGECVFKKVAYDSVKPQSLKNTAQQARTR